MMPADVGLLSWTNGKSNDARLNFSCQFAFYFSMSKVDGRRSTVGGPCSMFHVYEHVNREHEYYEQKKRDMVKDIDMDTETNQLPEC
jgi:hypothetical protein